MYIIRLDLDLYFFFFFKQKTAYEMRISDWSSDVCSSDLPTTSASASFRARRANSGFSPVRRRSSHRPRSTRGRVPARAQLHAADSVAARWPSVRSVDVRGWSGAPSSAVRATHRVDRGVRKRVVSGRSVAGRVDLGGCGNTK